MVLVRWFVVVVGWWHGVMVCGGVRVIALVGWFVVVVVEWWRWWHCAEVVKCFHYFVISGKYLPLQHI